MKQNLSDILKQVTKQEIKFIEQCTVRRVGELTCDVEPIYSSDFNFAVGNPKNYYYDIRYPKSFIPAIGSTVFVAFLSESEGIVVFTDIVSTAAIGTASTPLEIRSDKVLITKDLICKYGTVSSTHIFDPKQAVHLDIERFIVQTIGKSTLYISNSFNIVSDKPIFIGINDNVEYEKRNYTITSNSTKSEQVALFVNEFVLKYNKLINSFTNRVTVTNQLISVLNNYKPQLPINLYNAFLFDLKSYSTSLSGETFTSRYNKNLPDGFYLSVSRNLREIIKTIVATNTIVITEGTEIDRTYLSDFSIDVISGSTDSDSELMSGVTSAFLSLLKDTWWIVNSSTITTIFTVFDLIYYVTSTSFEKKDIISINDQLKKFRYGEPNIIEKSADIIKYVDSDTLKANLSLNVLLTEQNNLLKQLVDAVENLFTSPGAQIVTPSGPALMNSLTSLPLYQQAAKQILNDAKQLQSNIDKVLATKPDIA